MTKGLAVTHPSELCLDCGTPTFDNLPHGSGADHSLEAQACTRITLIKHSMETLTEHLDLILANLGDLSALPHIASMSDLLDDLSALDRDLDNAKDVL